MEKDNVLRPVFGKPRTTTTQATPPPSTELDSLPNPMLSMLEGSGEEVLVTLMGSKGIENLLNRLVARNERKIERYRNIVRDYSSADLQNWLKNPKDDDVRGKPAFYYALTDEMRRRGLFF